MSIEEEIARAVNHAGWTCDGGSDEPGQYDDCEDCKRVCDKFSAVLMPLVRRAQAEAWFAGYDKGNLDGYFGTVTERAESPYADLDPYIEQEAGA